MADGVGHLKLEVRSQELEVSSWPEKQTARLAIANRAVLAYCNF